MNSEVRVVTMITFSTTALIIYAVSCAFFLFLVASLYIIGLTPMQSCLRKVNYTIKPEMGMDFLKVDTA